MLNTDRTKDCLQHCIGVYGGSTQEQLTAYGYSASADK